MKAIYKRELQSYFTSMTGYVFIAFMTAIIGIYFVILNLMNGAPYFAYSLSSLSFTFLVAVPVLTMRSMSEEMKNKTDQLLLTSPVTVGGVVMGKYLAMVTVFGIVSLLTCACPLIMSLYGGKIHLSDYGSILAFFLMGCAAIALGLFVSALTESQIIACVGTFGALLILFLMSNITNLLPTQSAATCIGFVLLFALLALWLYSITKNWILSAAVGLCLILGAVGLYFWKPEMYSGAFQTILNSFSLSDRFQNFVYQMFDVSSVVYYLSFAAVFVFLTVQTVQKRRWS